MISLDDIHETATEIAAEKTTELESPVEPVGLVGEPAEQIVENANENDAEYIVVGPRKRSPAGKAVFGSVAQSVILNAEMPVLTTVGGDTA